MILFTSSISMKIQSKMYHEFWFIQKKQLLLSLCSRNAGSGRTRVGRNAGWVGTRVGTEGTHLSFSYSFRRILRNWYFFAFCWSDLLTAQYKIHILKIASFFFQQFTNLTMNFFFLISFFLIYFFLYFFRYIICMSTEKKNYYLYVRENIWSLWSFSH